jgi:hypothetical protein
MIRNAIVLCSVLTAAAALFSSTGCGNGSTGGGGSGGTGGATTSGTTSGTTSATNSTSTGSSVMLDCASYCGEVMTNCTADNAQFADMPTCMGTCAAYPKGMLADTSGNTLGCRIYHGGVAGKDAASAKTHCPHAGITGGDNDPTDTNPGTCGEACDSFCTVAAAVCPSAFATMDACKTACKGFTKDASDFNDTDTAKNDYGCRAYHLTAASASSAAATTHCPHIVAASPVCTM